MENYSDALTKEYVSLDQSLIGDVQATVSRFFPKLWPAVEVGLSTCATLLLSDNVNPVAVIYVGPPSTGKTTVVNMFDGALVNGDLLSYRSDKFTPAAFVSSAANVSRDELEKVDLLPRIKHKVLLTPEMSTIFRGKQDELADRFSVITRVLDGQGLMIDSGTHGRRGYEGDYLFAWLGATTPLDTVVWRVMAQLGSRLFFLVLDSETEPSIEDLISSNSSGTPYKDSLGYCQTAVHAILSKVFAQHKGVRQVQWNSNGNSRAALEAIARYATLLARMRSIAQREGVHEQESSRRANTVLYNVARGHALVCGRTHLTEEDLPIIANLTLSSMQRQRRALFKALVLSPSRRLTVAECMEVLSMSHGTAQSAMQELHLLGIAKFVEPGNGKASMLSLAQDWSWCAEDNLVTVGSILRAQLTKSGG
jgi:hypothetical protein